MARSLSHWPRKSSIKRCDLLSLRSRLISESSTSRSRSLPSAASFINAASGIEFQRKYDRRDASAASSSRPAGSIRYRKSGEHSAMRYAERIAVSKQSPSFKRASTWARYSLRTLASTSRRKALGRKSASSLSASASGCSLRTVQMPLVVSGRFGACVSCLSNFLTGLRMSLFSSGLNSVIGRSPKSLRCDCGGHAS